MTVNDSGGGVARVLFAPLKMTIGDLPFPTLSVLSQAAKGGLIWGFSKLLRKRR